MAFPDTHPIYAEGIFVLLAESVNNDDKALTSAFRLYLLTLPLEDTQVPLFDGRIVPKRERAVVVKDGGRASWSNEELAQLSPADYGIITGAIDEGDTSSTQAALRETKEECELILDAAKLTPVGDGRHIGVNQHRNGTEYEFIVEGYLYVMTQEEIKALTQNMEKAKRNILKLLWNGKEGDAATLNEDAPLFSLRPAAHAVLQLLTGLENPVIKFSKGI